MGTFTDTHISMHERLVSAVLTPQKPWTILKYLAVLIGIRLMFIENISLRQLDFYQLEVNVKIVYDFTVLFFIKYLQFF